MIETQSFILDKFFKGLMAPEKTKLAVKEELIDDSETKESQEGKHRFVCLYWDGRLCNHLPQGKGTIKFHLTFSDINLPPNTFVCLCKISWETTLGLELA